VIEGAEEHRLSVGPDRWIALKDVAVGQRIPLSVGDNLWPEQPVPISPPVRVAVPYVEDVALAVGVSAHTASRSSGGKIAYATDRIAAAAPGIGSRSDHAGELSYDHRLPLLAPTHLTEPLAEFLGYLLGGSMHVSGHAIGYVTDDRELAVRYAALVKSLYAIEALPFWNDKAASDKGGRWHVVFYSANVLELIQSLGIDPGAQARQRRIPDAILRSPKPVISAFLRAYGDGAGCASVKEGVMLSAADDGMAQTLQVLLLNYGILSRRYGPKVRITGASARLFAQEIGFGLARKRASLDQYIARHRWFRVEDPTDEVVSIERGMADVYDVTVDRAHCYVANGMLHHNSFWHARIMRELELTDREYAEFAQMHANVLAPSRTHLNPYHLGYKLFEDIERRWDNPSAEERERLGRKPGQGRAKIFEVRELENDVSFLRNYLTKDLIEELDLYIYRKEGDEWVIVEKNWEKVRDAIVASMTNLGYPYLVVDDADYRRNTELYIKHCFEGQELDLVYAEKTLRYVYQLWGRPVHLETVWEGKRLLLSCDGERSTKTTLDRASER